MSRFGTLTRLKMSVLNLLKKHVIDSQFFVALMGTLFAVFFMLEQNAFRFATVVLIFVTYFSGYLYTKFQGTKFFPKILIFNVICGMGSMIFIFWNHNEIRLLKWFIIVVLGLLYNSFFLEKFIRQIPLLKVFYVGLTWALINSWLILEAFNLPIFLISWLFISALVLPFDIRDMRDDYVVTFPKLIGIENTKYLAYLLVFISCIFSIFYLKNEFSTAFFLSSIVAFFFIYFSKNSNSESYFSFWVECCSGLPLLFLILLKYF